MIIEQTRHHGKRAASKYFKADLEQGINVVLGGRGADRLGLTEMSPKTFKALENNVNPHTRETLTARKKSTRYVYGEHVPNRRTMFEFLFTIPKSVSLYAALNVAQAPKIKQMVLDAFKETMSDLEKFASARVRKGGADYDRMTGEIMYVGFMHGEARPVSGLSDPDIHIHGCVMNATFDSVENKWKSLQPVDMVRHAGGSLNDKFMNRLQNRLNAHGIMTERKGRSFEIRGVSQETREMFSKRRTEIKTMELAEAQSIGRITAALIRDARKAGRILHPEKVRAQVVSELARRSRQPKMALSDAERLAALRAQLTPAQRASLTHVAYRPLAQNRGRVVAQVWDKLRQAERERVVGMER